MASPKVPAQFAGGEIRLLTADEIADAVHEYFSGAESCWVTQTKTLAFRFWGVDMALKVTSGRSGTWCSGCMDAPWLPLFVRREDVGPYDDWCEPHALVCVRELSRGYRKVTRLECPHWHDLVWLPATCSVDCGDDAGSDVTDPHRYRPSEAAPARTFKMPCWLRERMEASVRALPLSLTLEWVQSLAPRAPLSRERRAAEAPW